jgi:hypothetical protein
MSFKTQIAAARKTVSESLERLGPGPARLIAVGVPAALFILVIALILPSNKPGLGTASSSGYVGQVLVNGGERDNTVDSLTAAVEKLQHDLRDRDRKLDELGDAVRDLRNPGGDTSAPRTPPAPVAGAAPAATRAPSPPVTTAAGSGVIKPETVTTVSAGKPAVGAPLQMNQGMGSAAGGFSSAAPPASVAETLLPQNVWGTPMRTPASYGARPSPSAAVPGGGGGPGAPGPTRLFVYAPPAPPVTPLPPSGGGNQPQFELPPGATFGGVLLTGLDAPTAMSARRDPMPALLRIKHNTILPNEFDADQRECFVLVAGYGDLSAERAYLRTEELSCILADGSTFHERIEGYVVDESGRVGVRGPVVSRQGAFIARSLVVGIMQGLAEAFSRANQSYAVGISPGGQLSLENYQSMGQGGAVQGAAKGLDRVAQFYLDQAAAMFPVIEINAGRQVDIVLTKPVKVKLPGKS